MAQSASSAMSAHRSNDDEMIEAGPGVVCRLLPEHSAAARAHLMMMIGRMHVPDMAYSCFGCGDFLGDFEGEEASETIQALCDDAPGNYVVLTDNDGLQEARGLLGIDESVLSNFSIDRPGAFAIVLSDSLELNDPEATVEGLLVGKRTLCIEPIFGGDASGHMETEEINVTIGFHIEGMYGTGGSKLTEANARMMLYAVQDIIYEDQENVIAQMTYTRNYGTAGLLIALKSASGRVVEITETMAAELNNRINREFDQQHRYVKHWLGTTVANVK